MNCPGWRQLADTLPPGKSSSFADRGNLLHNAMEAILQDDVKPESVIGMEYEGIVLTEELYHEKIVPALAAVEEIFKTYGIDEWVCEERVGLADDAWGTGDVLGTGDTWAIVLDFKFGDGVIVTPKENHQFLFYGSAAYYTKETSDLFDEVDDVVFAVVQPSSHTASDYEVWETTVSRLRDYRKPFLMAVEEAKSENPQTCAGDHCKFCPAASICPQKTGAAQRALLMKPAELGDLREALKLAKELEDWIAAVRATAHEQLEKGADIKGWKLVMKRATRSWNDPVKAAQYLARKLGGKKNVVKEVPLTPAQAEKLAKAQKVTLSLSPMVSSKSSGTTLAPASDKRPAVIGGAAAQAALATIN
jgi:hypothetical protein